MGFLPNSCSVFRSKSSSENLRLSLHDFSVIILFVPLFSKMEFIRLFATSGKLVKWLYCAKESGVIVFAVTSNDIFPK